jgi:transcriptional regulator of acetoin/glycerol metabolism
LSLYSQFVLEARFGFNRMTIAAAAMPGAGRPQAAAAGPASCDDDATAAASLSMREIELRTIEEALAAHGGNVSAAARRLGISRSTIYRRLGITPGGH